MAKLTKEEEKDIVKAMVDNEQWRIEKKDGCIFISDGYGYVAQIFVHYERIDKTLRDYAIARAQRIINTNKEV